MKISKRQLKQIIKEEIDEIVEGYEAPGPGSHGQTQMDDFRLKVLTQEGLENIRRELERIELAVAATEKAIEKQRLATHEQHYWQEIFQPVSALKKMIGGESH